MTTSDLYQQISERRKKEQAEGLMPLWYTTGGAQMFYEKYEYQTNGRSVRGQFERIASTAAKYLIGTVYEQEAESKFFNLLWEGWLSPSTPVLANMGTDRGMSVSCSGGIIDDSIDGFYTARREAALLTKNGFGTSGYFGNIRPRGSKISKGGKASGVVPVMKGFFQDMRDVAQGTARRGAYGAYIEVEHGDFDEVANLLITEPDDTNIGWILTDSLYKNLQFGEKESNRRWKKLLKTKVVTGKGYLSFIDKINRRRPQMYVDHGLFVHASNLCNEITLFSDKDHTFTCVLASMNVSKFHEWKDTDAVFWATVFLDCVAEDFIQKGSKEVGLEKAVRFTKKGRALGLGQCGYHTLLQDMMIPYESFEAHMLNTQIAKHIHDESLRASKDMAINLGEPEWCVGYGVRNTHRIAIAPTKSTALLMGGISEGINPDPAMVYTQPTSAGEMNRVNAKLLQIMKERNVYKKSVITDILDNMGSVQHVTWLSDDEKKVFKTAFEINQEAVLRKASVRGRYIDQWQSLNLFFSADEDEEWIAHIHQLAYEDENILGLYYIYTQAGVQASKGECEACS